MCIDEILLFNGRHKLILPVMIINGPALNETVIYEFTMHSEHLLNRLEVLPVFAPIKVWVRDGLGQIELVAGERR